MAQIELPDEVFEAVEEGTDGDNDSRQLVRDAIRVAFQLENLEELRKKWL